MPTRRTFVQQIGASLAAVSAAASQLAAEPSDGQPRGSERLLVENPLHPTPAP